MARYALGPYIVASELPLDGLVAVDDFGECPDVTIHLELREFIGEAWAKLYQVGDQHLAGAIELWRNAVEHEFCLQFRFREHFADFFLSENGRRIGVSASPEVPPGHLATLLEGPVLGRALRLAGRPCLHATMLGWRGRAIGLMAPSGAGKSTLAAILVASGCTLLSDDLALLDLSSETLTVHAGRPRIRLWADNAAGLPVDISTASPILAGLAPRNKLAIAVGEDRRGEAAVPVSSLYQLGRREAELAAPRIEALTTQAALGAIASNFYGSIRPSSQIRSDELRLAARIADRRPLWRLTLPDSIEYLRSSGATLRDRLFS